MLRYTLSRRRLSRIVPRAMAVLTLVMQPGGAGLVPCSKGFGFGLLAGYGQPHGA